MAALGLSTGVERLAVYLSSCSAKGTRHQDFPLYSPFSLQQASASRFWLGLLPSCSLHHQQNGRYIALILQQYHVPRWSDFNFRAFFFFTMKQFFCLERKPSMCYSVGMGSQRQIFFRWSGILSCYIAKAVPTPCILYKCTAYLLPCDR